MGGRQAGQEAQHGFRLVWGSDGLFRPGTGYGAPAWYPPQVSQRPAVGGDARRPYGRHGYPRPVDPAMVTHGQRAAWFAQARLGLPYCWGGKGPRCYDCSGLTYMAWRSVGRTIPRTSTAQHERLGRVRMNQLRPGDILWRPGHVGIYVGNGWAVHAPGRNKPIQYQPANRFRHAMRP